MPLRVGFVHGVVFADLILNCGEFVLINDDKNGVMQMPQTNPKKEKTTWGPALFMAVLLVVLMFFWWLLINDHGVMPHG